MKSFHLIRILSDSWLNRPFGTPPIYFQKISCKKNREVMKFITKFIVLNKDLTFNYKIHL
jgi:hypothetical protein